MGNPVIGSTFKYCKMAKYIQMFRASPRLNMLTCADTVTCRLRTALAEDMGAGIRRR